MLKQLQIKGFKTIKDQTIDLGKMNVLIGANGAGKSNFVSFFKMLNSIVLGKLQTHISTAGGADFILYYSSKATESIESSLTFEIDNEPPVTYYQLLTYADPDSLIIHTEYYYYQKDKSSSVGCLLKGTSKESDLSSLVDDDIYGKEWLERIHHLISQCCCFQFHDTSKTAKVKQNCYIEDNQYLRSDGGNLSAYLYMLRETKRLYYNRIILTIRQILPFFDDFVLERSRLNENNIMLNWKEKDSDLLFGPHQLSDGSLRMMALVTLLFQPEEFLPEVILIDEPELGLHPYAIEIIASLIQHASEYSQVIIATQSADLMDCFEPDEIIVTERHNKETIFKRLDSKKLEEWREEYTMSELWKKNVLGGRPS